MPPKKRFLRMEKDDLIWEKLEEDVDEWNRSIRTNELYHAVANMILKYTSKDGQPMQLHTPVWGAYNKVYRLEYKDGSSVVMRVPMQGAVQFPEEKIRYEVATIRHIATHTTIPVLHIYHHRTAAENPTGLGPFIIMDYIDHHQNMSRALADPGRDIGERPVLDPNITEGKLELLYGQIANILLQLSTLKFPRLGSLMEEEGVGSVSVGGRPLISNMNDIVQHINAPEEILPSPSQSYSSAHEWYSSLADMHMAQLALQHNDAVEDEEDARDKYVARQLFRNLAQPTKTEGDFRLFSEDLRPANVLLDENIRVVGVIDWEFAYAAPAQYSFDPPWWLLIKEPEWTDSGYHEWMKAYKPRLQTFLRVLEAEEAKIAATDLADTGKQTWLLNYAARKSWAFDYVWWKFLDEQYFGPNEDQDYKIRLALLSEPQRKAMESFVARKMEGSKDRKIVMWEKQDAADRLAEVLI
ncbi:phosphotransferase family protein [Emericellopsis atlantica]|uniref:Phosphotransferase family protein n=1 Tax=Emericellopsis atlantica TaxID=2614577 RepID=A0A9P7ZI90_9HYPO|nr:phosphotransferase family protein [Emericellopsis atlantica]KAG9252416.1 phosphotransferase family protein [Emericellopsis atlantica]